MERFKAAPGTVVTRAFTGSWQRLTQKCREVQYLQYPGHGPSATVNFSCASEGREKKKRAAQKRSCSFVCLRDVLGSDGLVVRGGLPVLCRLAHGVQ